MFSQLSENIAIDTVGPLKKGKQRWRKKKDKGKDEEDVVAMEPGIMKIRKVQKMKAKKVRKEKARRGKLLAKFIVLIKTISSVNVEK